MKALQDSIFLTAAYNRRYRTKQQAYSAWLEGKDFFTSLGCYCSIRDTSLLKQNHTCVYIQYDMGILEI